jgi:Uma2 family endonuclease
MSVKQLMTVDEFVDLPEVPGKRFELVNGELFEVTTPSPLHNLIVFLMAKLIDAVVVERRLGYTFTDSVGYTLRREPGTVRIPDVSFVSHARLPEGGLTGPLLPIAPDLAVEVASPSDRLNEMRLKVRDYLDAGSRMVWVVLPELQMILVYLADAPVRELGSDDMLDGGDVLPGFQVRVGQLFAIERRPADASGDGDV